MDVFVELYFSADYSMKNDLERFFHKFGISCELPEPEYPPGVFPTLIFPKVPIRINDVIANELIYRILFVLERDYQISASEAIMFKFNRSDFENSPIFEL